MVRTILAALAVILFSLPLAAQTGGGDTSGTEGSDGASGPSITFDFFSVRGLRIGIPFALDDAYEQEVGRPIPARLKLVLPKGDGSYRVLVDKDPGGAMVKFNFATRDLQLIDNLQIVNATIATGPIDDRLQAMARLIKDQAYPISVRGYSSPKLIGLGKYRVGDLPAVLLVATYTDPANGPMFLRIVGLPHPDKPESIVVVTNTVASKVPVKTVSELEKSLSGRALASIRFTD